ncbi:MAG: hypothetical protein EOO46_20765 [Flavobacterium sp.]|nr:MAG: hypothetical protein EOO46_20765 [Flavobacterium sp.]
MRKQLFTTACLLIIAVSSFAQTLSIENVQKVSLRNTDAIKEGTEVKGYYFFYVSDKIDKKTNEYTLQITDNNLKKLKDIKFEDSKDLSILESSFNGTDLIFLMYNSKERTFEHQVFGADGKKKFSYTRELSKKEKRFLEGTYLQIQDEEDNFKGLYPVQGKGFISNMPSREDRDYTFQIDYFSTESRKQWTYIPDLAGKKFIGDVLGVANNVVYIETLIFGGFMDQKPESMIIGLSLDNGKKLFEKKTDFGSKRFYPASLSNMDNGKAVLFGEYFGDGANILKDKSQGFAFIGMDEKGEATSQKFNSWDEDMSKYLDVKSKGKIADFGFMYVHNIVQAADGNIFAIGEGYKKVASALGIAATVLSRGNAGISTMKLKVTDMIVLKFDKDFNIKAANIYEKNSNKIELPGGYEFVSGPLIGKMIKFEYGGFDYSYTKQSGDKSTFSIYYSDYVRGKDYKGGTFNAITYNDGKFTTDKINTKSEATSTSILPAKQGQVLVLDYYKKAKKLDAHFEKLD